MRSCFTVCLISWPFALSALAACRSSEAVPAAPQSPLGAAASAPVDGATDTPVPPAEPPVDAGVPDAAATDASQEALDASDAASPTPDRRWTHVAAPARGAPAAIGEYANGCLRGGAPLPPSPNHVVMHPSRRRFFGHPALVSFLGRLGEGAHKLGLAPIYIGDLAQPRGGPTLTGHASHQTGLDVDVSFIPPKPKSQGAVTAAERESLSARAIVNLTTNKLTPAFDTGALRLVEIAAQDPAVERIFVNAVVKQKLCETAKGKAWIGRVRPWWGHHDHFHVRLHCPVGDRACVAQPPLPANDGCDASLAWWFSAEARAGQKPKSTPPPKLPSACEDVLSSEGEGGENSVRPLP